MSIGKRKRRGQEEEKVVSLTIKRKDEKDIHLGRVFAGIGWPGARPGFALVMGESARFDIGLPTHYHYWLLAEFEGRQTDEFIETCLGWQKKYNVERFLSKPNLERDEYIHFWNMTIRPSGTPRLRLATALYSQDNSLDYHWDIIAYVKNHRLIHLTELVTGAQIKEYNMQVDVNNEVPPTKPGEGGRMKLDSDQMPAVAALGYVMTEFREYPPPEASEYDEKRCQAEPERGY